MFKKFVKNIESNRSSKNIFWSALASLKDAYFRTLNNIALFFYKIFLSKKLSQDPILIGGCGRSGTTLLLSILSAHPEICAVPHETNAFVKRPNRLYKIYFYLLRKCLGSKKENRWMEKTPRNIENVDRIFKKFDNKCKFINIVRDGRDVILSKHPLRADEYWVKEERWIEDVELGIKFEGRQNFITIRYEDLILDYDRTMSRLCDFLQIPFVKELSDWHKFTTVKTNRAWPSDVKPIFSKSIGKWKQDEYDSKVKGFASRQSVRRLLKHYNYE